MDDINSAIIGISNVDETPSVTGLENNIGHYNRSTDVLIMRRMKFITNTLFADYI